MVIVDPGHLGRYGWSPRIIFETVPVPPCGLRAQQINVQMDMVQEYMDYSKRKPKSIGLKRASSGQESSITGIRKIAIENQEIVYQHPNGGPTTVRTETCLSLEAGFGNRLQIPLSSRIK